MKRLLISFKTQVLYVTDVNMSKPQWRKMAGHIKKWNFIFSVSKATFFMSALQRLLFRKPRSSCQRCKDCCSPSHQHSTFHFQYVLLCSTLITQTDPVLCIFCSVLFFFFSTWNVKVSSRPTQTAEKEKVLRYVCIFLANVWGYSQRL